jgi:hypothetical protein
VVASQPLHARRAGLSFQDPTKASGVFDGRWRQAAVKLRDPALEEIDRGPIKKPLCELTAIIVLVLPSWHMTDTFMD